MAHITFLPHTADIRMHIEAATREELFDLALRGMNSILHNSDLGETDQNPVTYDLYITSLDRTTVLIDFLSEVLSESYEKKTVFHTLNILQLKDNSVNAVLNGHPVTKFDEDIKAVTYHEAEVKQNARGFWETVIIFDI